jgi:tRNA-Thr(GGU) m(6)t(6)A37 methyltransferase TsaA
MILTRYFILLVLYTALIKATAQEPSSCNEPISETMVIQYHPIGEFHTGLTPQTGAPRQGILESGNKGIITIYEEYGEALQGLDRYEYIFVLYHLHLSANWHPVVRPPGSNQDFGLFATRSPNRPNPIGLAVIRLDGIEGLDLHVSGIDAFDGTPVLDIKPWLPSIDCPGVQTHTGMERDLGLGE